MSAARWLAAALLTLALGACGEDATPLDGATADAGSSDAGLDATGGDAGSPEDGGLDAAGDAATICEPACTEPCAACVDGACELRGATARAIAIATGWNQSLAIDEAGRLWAWGANNTGQLGLGDTVDRDLAQPVGGADRFVRVASGSRHSCAIRDDGALLCWGVNVHGQLGTGDTVDRDAPARVGDASDWTEVACGGLHTCGLRGDGELHCWGSNPAGQLGIGEVADDQLEPVRVGDGSGWRELVAQTRHTCALRDAGSLFCWGDNSDGQLGLGDQVDRRTPQHVRDGVAWARTGALHTCAIDLDGALFCWGANDHGTLGQGDRETPRTTPLRVGDASDWVEVAGGFQHTCGVRAGGALHCWGDGTMGQLGLLPPIEIALPQRVGDALGWTGVGGGIGHTCALAGGEPRCWGDGSRGQTAAASLARRDEPAPACFATP